MDLRTNRGRGAFSCRQSFDTKAGEIITVRLPLADFKATNFGRRAWLAPALTPSEIKSLGFTLYDKKAGPFRLDVIAIGFEEEEPVKVADASSLIDRSIQLGVPLYNNGSPAACAAVYEVTLRSFLVDGNDAVNDDQRERIAKALNELPEDADKRAWALRHELDRLHEAIAAD